jgi:hypothetical protein
METQTLTTMDANTPVLLPWKPYKLYQKLHPKRFFGLLERPPKSGEVEISIIKGRENSNPDEITMFVTSWGRDKKRI